MMDMFLLVQRITFKGVVCSFKDYDIKSKKAKIKGGQYV